MATATRTMSHHGGGTGMTGMLQLQPDRQLYPVIDAVVTDEAVGSLKVGRTFNEFVASVIPGKVELIIPLSLIIPIHDGSCL